MRLRGMDLRTVQRLISCSLRSVPDGLRHVFLCIADHYEPDVGKASDAVRLERVERWIRDYPRSVEGIADSLGRQPQHTFFYPLEEYRPILLDRLGDLCRRGLGEVEVHLHHDGDTSQQLRDRLEGFKQTLHDRHGLLRRDAMGTIRFGFIHGNWALDNSRPDGRWCGVNDELTVLRETGCYADFTMPSAPDPTQTRTFNSIYYATDDPAAPKSHDTGTRAGVGHSAPEDTLLMIQGPLIFDWRDRKFGLVPRLENGDLHAHRPPAVRRLNLWLQAGVHVQGRPDWIFVKLHTHGAKPANTDVLLGSPMRRLHEELHTRAEADTNFRYYYVTAHDMARLVRAAEVGETDPRSVLTQGGPAGDRIANRVCL